ncbi:ead/Ea22-like family protein [Klebsiella variicola]|uniref:ead/Ea22-like family protein n=1 Tax=Klebsiella variicola TaxID=244366 RepID=UPI0023798961|nr:ead/Ea22-like family protein [Klebsiella variicola]MDD9249350.1 ead/Ea22-like family protein [Klebsiella variicola]
MTTDITELAQRMRTAAEKAGIEQWVNNRGEVNTADYEVDGGMYIDHICDCEIVGTESPRAEFIALANPANVLALVEALEKAQLSIAELEREQEHLRPVGVMSEKAFHRLENSECRFIALWPRPGIFLPRKRPEDGVIVYARTAAPQEVKP